MVKTIAETIKVIGDGQIYFYNQLSIWGKNRRFTLYEDEGTNYNYERGKYATIPFSYDDKTQTLTIGKREGSFDGMLQLRQFKVVYRHPGVKVQDLDIDGVDGMTVDYSGNAMKIKLK